MTISSAAALDYGAATNLVINGGFETNTTGWTASGTNTIARSTEQAKFGAASLKVTYQDNTLLTNFPITLTAALHTSSAWVYIPAAYDGTQVSLVTSPNGTMGFVGVTVHSEVQADMDLVDQWQRVSVTFTPAGGDVIGRIDIAEDVAPTAGRFIYIDGVQCELGSATPYIETNGGTASRASSAVNLPVRSLNGARGALV